MRPEQIQEIFDKKVLIYIPKIYRRSTLEITIVNGVTGDAQRVDLRITLGTGGSVVISYDYNATADTLDINFKETNIEDLFLLIEFLESIKNPLIATQTEMASLFRVPIVPQGRDRRL